MKRVVIHVDAFTALTRKKKRKSAGWLYPVHPGYRRERDAEKILRNQLEIKTRYEQEKLAMDRASQNQLDANIQRLHYSLEIANAAGIKRPVYSNGQAVKDDPDFLFLGADGISRKLKLKRGNGRAEIDGDLRNRQYHVEQLAAMNE